MSDTKLECLMLSEPDLIEAGVLNMKQCVRTMEEVFHLYSQGDFLMAGPHEKDHGALIQFPTQKRIFNMPDDTPDRRYMAMVGYLGGRFHVLGGKYYGSNRENLERGLPRSILTVFLNDVDTGAPLAIMSGNLISAMRTGAIPGVVTKHVQAEDASTFGIVGGGVIGRGCFLSINETLRNKKRALVYDIVPERAEAFCKEMIELTGLDVQPAESLEALARESDVICMASSGKNPAHIHDEWLRDGACVIIVGGGLLDDSFYTNLDNRIIFDCYKMHEIWMEQAAARYGSIEGARNMFACYQYFKLLQDGKLQGDTSCELGDIVSGRIAPRTNNKQKMVFISGGLALEDLGWGYELYQTALRKGLGQKFKFWDTPYWS
ncbi:tyramine oxidase subunit B [Clostridiales bacterium]